MKKLMLTLIGLLVSTTLFSQTCIIDAWQCLQNEQAPKARTFIEQCLEANPDNAEVWLMRGNVYLQLSEYDNLKKEKDPNYKARYPDAVWIANESFIKALQLDPEVKPREKMFSALYGQSLCAGSLFNMGLAALNDKNFTDATKYFNTSATDFMIGRDTVDAGKACYLLAVVYTELKDQDNAKKALMRAVNYKSTSKDVYIALYDIFKQANDTINCGKIIEKAKLMVPQSDQKAIIELQMEYFSNLNMTDKLIELCENTIKQNPDDTTMVANCSNYLSNCGAYSKAEEVLNKLLTTYPNSFSLNKQMGYRFYREAIDYEKEIDAATVAKDYTKVNQLKDEQKVIFKKAHDWCDKAYSLNKDDLDNDKILRQLKVQLLIPVPDELNNKVNSYMKTDK